LLHWREVFYPNATTGQRPIVSSLPPRHLYGGACIVRYTDACRYVAFGLLVLSAFYYQSAQDRAKVVVEHHGTKDQAPTIFEIRLPIKFVQVAFFHENLKTLYDDRIKYGKYSANIR
jgi:hypothetical protein